MNLTKDDFTIHGNGDGTSFMYLDNYNPYEMIEQILENQEKAKIMRQLETKHMNIDFGLWGTK